MMILRDSKGKFVKGCKWDVNSRVPSMLGKQHNEESKYKIGSANKISLIGNTNKSGKKVKDKTKIVLAGERNKGIHFSPDTEFKKGLIPWNKEGLTPINQLIRTSLRGEEWKTKVFERDNYTCQHCGDNRGGNLVAHHKVTLSYLIRLMKKFYKNGDNLEDIILSTDSLFDINNGLTLCETCHKKWHKNNPRHKVNELIFDGKLFTEKKNL